MPLKKSFKFIILIYLNEHEYLLLLLYCILYFKLNIKIKINYLEKFKACLNLVEVECNKVEW